MSVILVKYPFFIDKIYYQVGRHEIDDKLVSHPFVKERAIVLEENKRDFDPPEQLNQNDPTDPSDPPDPPEPPNQNDQKTGLNNNNKNGK